MAFTLMLNRPRMDNRDCIRGWEWVALSEFGAFEHEPYAEVLAVRLEKEWCLELGDGESIHVWKDGKPKPARALPVIDDDWEIPF